MKYFLDTEFIEYPCTIDLVSVGIVCEDGREFYAESTEFDDSVASQWVLDNVIAKLWSKDPSGGKFEEWEKNGGFGGWHDRVRIKDDILEFVGGDIPEFWGYYADYDWVVFCWLFGSMMHLPEGWPMYCRDIKQLAKSLGNPDLPKQEQGEHLALHDARWNKKAYEFLEGVALHNFQQIQGG